VRAHWANWPFRDIDEDLSILDVVGFGTIDFQLAGLLWLLMEKRPSVMVAAGPIWAGKSTLFHALLDFLSPEIEQVSLRGFDEDFRFLGNDKPENTYLVSEEISNHSYEYLWGPQVVEAFRLLSRGYALGATTHARNIREVAYVLNALGVPTTLIAGLGIIVTLQVTRGRSYHDEPIRYVDTVSTLNLTKDGLVAQMLATRHSPDEKFVYPPEKSLNDMLSSKFFIKYRSISAEIKLRADYLEQLQARGPSSRQEVKKAISEYRRSRSS
jgi:hypothetical protein